MNEYQIVIEKVSLKIQCNLFSGLSDLKRTTSLKNQAERPMQLS